MPPPPCAPVVIRLNPSLLLRWACTLIAVLVATSVLADLLTSARGSILWKVASVDSEEGVATMYAILQLAACAVAACIAGYVLRRGGLPWGWHWFAVGALLAIVAVDEEIGWHETVSIKLSNAWNTHGPFRYAWVVPGLVAVGVLAAVFLRFVLALPRPVRTVVVASAAVYVTGAVGVEMICGWIDDGSASLTTSLVAAYTVEETLELLGVALMGYAISRFLVEYLDPVSLTTASRPKDPSLT